MPAWPIGKALLSCSSSPMTSYLPWRQGNTETADEDEDGNKLRRNVFA